MNNIFIDYSNKNNKKNKFKDVIFKYNVVDDMLNNKLVKNTYITLDKYYMENITKKNRYNIYDRIFKFMVNLKYSVNDEVNVIFSNLFDNESNIKSFILDLLRLNSLTIYKEIKNKNTLKINDVKYIEKCPSCEGVLIRKGDILRCSFNYTRGCMETKELELDKKDLEFDYE